MAAKLDTLAHEQFIARVRTLVASQQPADIAEALLKPKIIYGVGPRGVRGQTIYSAWHANGHGQTDLIEIAAAAEESPLQLAGTTIHELAHSLAGAGHGHDNVWKETCHSLGLRRAKAAGNVYQLAQFAPALRQHLLAAVPTDGLPSLGQAPGLPTLTLRPCSAGIGTRGGKSRGLGSGSRLRLWTCACDPVVKVRIASDDFRATCERCGTSFTRATNLAD